MTDAWVQRFSEQQFEDEQDRLREQREHSLDHTATRRCDTCGGLPVEVETGRWECHCSRFHHHRLGRAA